jgi:polysaccharide biosynthesis transport protein
MTALTQDPAAATPFQDEEGKSLADMLAILRRWRGTMLAVFCTLLLIGVLVAFALPAVYRSSATILIKEQEIPQEFVRSTVTSFADERIQVISQQVMTRGTILELVDKYQLYGNARQRETSEEIIDRMRRDIKLTPISAEVTDRRSGSPVKATIAFTLSFDSEVPAYAQKVANDLATLFLNENIKNRQQKAAETTSFLDEELGRVVEHISELEKSLADFKRRNQGRTPDQAQINLSGSERTEADLQRIDREIAFLGDRKRLLENQLLDTKAVLPLTGTGGPLDPEDRLRALRSQLASLNGLYSDSHPDVRRVKREIASLQTESGLQGEADDRELMLDSLRGELASLRKRYSDEHPDVLKLRRTYDALQAAIKAGPVEGKVGGGALRAARKPDNPTWISLQTQIATTQSQLESLVVERKEMAARLDQLSSRLAQSPEVEREYLELVRDMESSRGRFRELRDKQMQAQVAEQLERTRKAERFTLIEPPIFPEKPYRPNRQLIVMMAALLALAGALAAAALAHALDGQVHGAKDVVRLMQVPVLAVLPTPPQPVSLRRRTRAGLLLALILLLTLATGLAAVHFLYMPLDVAWYALLRRLAR